MTGRSTEPARAARARRPFRPGLPLFFPVLLVLLAGTAGPLSPRLSAGATIATTEVAGASTPPDAEAAPVAGTRPAGDTLPGVDRLAGADQHVLVVVEGPEEVTGRLHRFERRADGWTRVGPAPAVVVGRSGVGEKREGDGRSPAGVFALGPAFGYAEDPPAGVALDYRPMAAGTVCVDDPASSHYNRIVDPDRVDRSRGGADWNSAERMRRDRAHGDDLYEWGIVVGHNPDREPGAGSCIFLHVWRDEESPTVGCTALSEPRLLEVMRWLEPSRGPVLVQGTRGQLDELHRRGRLPYPPPSGG